MADDRAGLRMSRLLGPMAVYVLIGAPLVAYVWETLNVLLTGQVDFGRIGLAVLAAIVLAVLFRLMQRSISRWETERVESVAPSRPEPHHPRGP
jgi:hypothetical protein